MESPESRIESGLAMLNEHISMSEKMLQDLEVRLSRVMRSAQATKEEGRTATVDSSPLAAHLDELACRVRVTNETLSTLMSRLEL